MFDLDVSKMLVVGAIALVVVGPKELPRVLQTAGQILARLQRIRTDLRKAVMDFVEEADLGSINKELATVENSVRVNIALSPATAMRGHLPSASGVEAATRKTDGDATEYASPEMEAYLAPPPEPLSLVGEERPELLAEVGIQSLPPAPEICDTVRPDRTTS